MTYHKTLFQSFVAPFYKENAGAFLFFIILLFCIIGKVDGAELFEYHLSLATGILQNFSFLLLVLFAWLVYARKFVVFVSGVIADPQFGFLHIFNQLSRAKRLRLFFVIEVWLLMPILLYCLFLFYVTLGMHSYLPMVIIVLYLLLLAGLSTLWHVRLLGGLPAGAAAVSGKSFRVKNGPVAYKSILLHFIARQQFFIWLGIKIFTCGYLYFIAKNNSVANYDISMAYIFYTFGILANGVLIFRIRAFEEMYLAFYKGLAVTISSRFLDYCFIYAVLLVPEMATLYSLFPMHISGKDGLEFLLNGFSMLLFMNSLTFFDSFTMKEYLKILFALLFASCISFTAIGLGFFTCLLAVLAILLFVKGYYQFEKKQGAAEKPE